jgi:transcriptional regulator with XRE-family HTH domain
MHKRIDAVILWCVSSAKYQHAQLIHVMHTECRPEATDTVQLMFHHDPASDDPRTIIARLKQEQGWSNEEIADKIAEVLVDPKARLNRSTLSRIASGENSPSDRTRRGLIALHEAYPPRQAGFAESPVERLSMESTGQTRTLAPGQSFWRVKQGLELPPGYLTGDQFILDQNLRPILDKDHILVTVAIAGGGKTLMGTYQQGWFIPPNPGTAAMLQIGGEECAFLGIVIESWRTRR